MIDITSQSKARRPLKRQSPAQMEQLMPLLGKAVNDLLPDGYGFVVLVMPCNVKDANLDYVASVERSTAAEVMQELIKEWQA